MESVSALLVFIARLRLVRRQFAQIASAKSRQTLVAFAVLPARQREQSTIHGNIGCSI
jgi:hypothetical protein